MDAMEFWTPSMKSYTDDSVWREKCRKNIIAKAELAASWGVSDNQSVGYTQSDLCSIIRELTQYIKENDVK